ncbi:MAG: EamA family transporter [Pseudomonadota bacterium]|nr:EamA family transporter [Pseudomonadota bacterium]
MKQASPVFGSLIVAIGALSLAGNNVFAVVSFESGASPLTVITGRMIITLIALFLLMRSCGRQIALPRHDRDFALGLGVLNGLMAYCLLSAFDKIQVGLAILVFYFYPLLTGLCAWITGQEKLTRGLLLGLIGGFAGLVIALEVTADISNLFGLLFAAAASLLMAANALLSSRILTPQNSMSVTLHMHIASALIFIIAFFIVGDADLPQNTWGWVSYFSVPIFYMIGVTAFFYGISCIGAVRASVIMNLEPIGSIALGFIVLGQILSPSQLIGATCVIVSLIGIRTLDGGREV